MDSHTIYKLIIYFNSEIRSGQYRIKLNRVVLGAGCLHHLFFVLKITPPIIINSWKIYANGDEFCNNSNYAEIIGEMEKEITFDNSEYFFTFMPDVNKYIIQHSKNLQKLNSYDNKNSINSSLPNS